MTKEELKDYLINEADYGKEEVNIMSPYQMIHAWLISNEIIGYTSEILDVIEASNYKF